ncbi:MAG: glycosyl hydrolase [Sphingomonadaceae bacterium]
MKSELRTRLLITLAATISLSACATPQAANQTTPLARSSAATDTDRLSKDFADPPRSARPRAWWHWMNGNVTKDGIAKDLEWMHWVGLGGFQNFDANLATPQVVDKRLVYMEPDWKDAFRFAGQKAEELGLEMAIAASPGWSETGGPWVPPQDGLKKLVWSETVIEGGQPFTGTLVAPPNVTGPFLNIPKQPSLSELMGGGEIFRPQEDKSVPKYYADARVIAFPATATTSLATPRLSLSSGQKGDLSALMDGDLMTSVKLSREGLTEPLQLRYDYARPQTVRSISVFVPGASAMFLGSLIEPYLEASDNGTDWTKIADLSVMPVQVTTSFKPVTARHFRVTFAPGNFGIASMGAASEGTMGIGPSAMMSQVAKANLNVAELTLSGDPVVDQFEAKAGFEIEKDYYHLGHVDDGATGIDPEAVIDLTDRMKPDGSLDWTPPAGKWKVLRLGWSLLGTTNHPATPEATGLEVDKYDGPAVRRYLEHYLGMYADALGVPIAQQDMLDAILTDSIEVGAANWTPAMIEKFTQLRGYDPTPWLPALTGVIVKDRKASDLFLYDYRRTLADLLSSEHYGTVAKVAHENGLIVYGEALENGRPSLGDDLTMRSHADIPMSAMWTHSRKEGPNYAHVADMKGAASVAHLYGRKYVAAESMTAAMAPWDHVPSFLKRIIDLEFVNGVNRPVIHTSVHQPVDDKVPGLSLFIFGQYFNRHEAWAPLARPWIDYVSRTSYLLQQGRNVADIAYFYGEDAPPAAMYQGGWMKDDPKAFAWDFVSSDAIEDILTVKDGRIVSPGGAQYNALYLGGTAQMMTLPVLKKLAEMVRGGATVIGAKPRATPSLADDEAEFAGLADALWGGDTGSGKVIVSNDPERALWNSGVAPAFRFTGGSDGARIPFVEREWDGGRLFFLSNPGAGTEAIEAHFRVTGKTPELWDAQTGKRSPVSYRTEGGETIVPLTMASDDSVFVLFAEDTQKASVVIGNPRPKLAAQLTGPWSVSFDGKQQSVPAIEMATLERLDTLQNPAVRYFSGVATYASSFDAPAGWEQGNPLWLDLGEAHDVAEVWVNGTRVGGLWRAPWRIDVGSAAKAGKNSLEIKIANKWVNRLIGDAQEGAEKVTFTPLPTYRADAPLRPSGLVGPVTLSTAE